MADRSVAAQAVGDPLSRHDFRSSVDDKVLFIAALIVGIAGILLLKLVLEARQFLVTALPVSLMLVYAVVIWRSERFRLRDDRAGDNLYYLGFLYTLASLALALFQFSSEKSSADEIISNFGIALATTIVGLALRVLLNQMREDPLEYEGRARVALSDAANKLRSELDGAVSGVQSFQRSTLDALDATVKHSKTVSAEQISAIAAMFGRQTGEVLQEFKKATMELAENTENINRTIKQVAEASEQMCARIAAINPPSDMVDRKLEAVAGRLVAASAALEGAAASFGRVLETTDVVERSAQALAERVTVAGSLGSVLAETGGSLEKLGAAAREEVSAHHKHLESLRKAFEDDVAFVGAVRDKSQALAADTEAAIVSMKATVKSLGEVGRRLNGRTEAVAAAIEQVAVKLAGTEGVWTALAQAQAAGEGLAGRIGELAEKLSGIEGQLSDGSAERLRIGGEIKAAFESDLSAVRRLREELDRESQLSAQAVARVSTTLRSLGNTLIEGLNESR